MKQEPSATPSIETAEDDDEQGYSTGKTLCLLVVFVCGLLMFALPMSKLVLALDVLTHFSLHYMVAGAAFLAAFFLPRWNFATAVVLTIIGFYMIGYLATHKSPPSEKTVAANATRLKIMTFNTWLRNHDWQAIAREIVITDPDVVTLVEFGKEKAPLLAKLKTRYPYQLSCFNIRYCHMAILSKFPFTESKARTRWRGPPYLQARFGAALGHLTLYAVHTIRPPYYNAHLKQVRVLSDIVRQRDGLKIVMGDFNSTPFSRTLSAFGRRTRLTRITDTPSWPGQLGELPQVAIDHIFVSPQIKVLAPHRIGKRSGSDHFPVYAVVGVPNGR